MRKTRCALIRVACMSCLLAAACATTAMAQTTVRVTRDRTTIWKSDFRATAAVVDSGTILTVIGRRGDWYEVIVPDSRRGAGSTIGFIFGSNVEFAAGAPPSPPPSQQSAFASGAPPSPQPTQQSAPDSRSRALGVWGFGHFGYTWFAARNSFRAVLAQPGGLFLGAGGELRVGDGFFVSGSLEHFDKTGQRVFVVDRQVFGLGISDKVTMTPFAMTAGWRFANEKATPYVGAGAGSMHYKETSTFADDAENVESRFTSYHVLGGVEFRNGWVATAFEVQYTRVPNALGVEGASAAFGERNLGGFASRVKILVGR